MNTTDYFTNINAMFLFCIFTCGLLVWAVIRIYILKSNMNNDLNTANDRIKQLEIDIANGFHKYELLHIQHIERGKRIIALEVAKDNAEKESRDLRKQLTESETQANGYKAEFIAVSNELEATKAKVRKRDANGKFLPSGNGRVRTPKKLKLVTDLGENEVIHCKTEDERLAIRTLMHEAGLKFKSGERYIDKGFYGNFGELHCYRPKSGTILSLASVHKEDTVHPASDFIARPKRVKKVDDEKAYIKEVKSAIDELNEAFGKIKEIAAAQPKLVHGLTVKNPTEDEAKMIFDEARRLGVTSDRQKHSVMYGELNHIWFHEKFGICYRIDILRDGSIEHVVTAKEFVQRMQNGRM